MVLHPTEFETPVYCRTTTAVVLDKLVSAPRCRSVVRARWF